MSISKKPFEIALGIMDMMQHWQLEPCAHPSTEIQKQALDVMYKLQSVSRHLRGMTGYKQYWHNELRGLICAFGTPA